MSRAGWALTLAAAAAVTGVIAWRLTRHAEEAPKFRTEAITRGDVVQAVTASGSLSAVTTVKVGSQVSGIVAALHADFNSPVAMGQLLAELDPQPFQAAVDQREADLERSRAELRDAERELARARRLHAEGIQSQVELDSAVARSDSASAMVKQGEAALRQARVNLENCRITSPIDGVVVDRQYDIGQTVAASFQAPTLFTIAKDLTKMQVLTNIDEADIGGVRTGQPATFSVDAFPDETFRGVVSQVRLSAQTVQNVVTYPVVIDVDNPDGRLKPGMTANVSVPVQSRSDVLRIPNSALRFRPEASMVAKAETPAASTGAAGEGALATKGKAPQGRAARDGGAPDQAAPGMGSRARGAEGEPPSFRPEGGAAPGASEPSRGEEGGRPGGSWSRRNGMRGPGGGSGPGAAAGSGAGPIRGAVAYVLAPGGKVRAVPVRTSITDGNLTAIEPGELEEGDEVVTGLATTRAMTSGSRPPGMGGMGGGMRGPRM